MTVYMLTHGDEKQRSTSTIFLIDATEKQCCKVGCERI